jgi:ubiquinone/menaquinone biosynthesis C-methylase UbiE
VLSVGREQLARQVADLTTRLGEARRERDGLAVRVEALSVGREQPTRQMADLTRSDYKSVWNDLSGTVDDAKMVVIGSVDENAFLQTAQETLGELENTVGVRPSDIILEIGCGVGRVGASLAPRCAKWIGCDVSSKMIEYSTIRLNAHQNVSLIEISGFSLDGVKDATIDMVYCTVVFMHLDEWDRYNYVLEAKRVLRPGGRLYIDNFNLCTDGGWTVFETHRTHFAPGSRPAHISKSSTPQELETYLTRAGFKSVGLRERRDMIAAFGTKP